MNKEIIIKAIKTHVKDFKGIDLKSFYEELGFDDVYTADDSYMDYFKSKDYLESHVTDIERTKHLLENHGITIPMDDNIEYIKDTLNSLRINSLPIREDFKNRVLKMKDEAVKMADAETFLGIMVYAGSILEGILLGLLQNTDNSNSNISILNDIRRDFSNSSKVPSKKEFPSPKYNDLNNFVQVQYNTSELSNQKTSDVVKKYNEINGIRPPKETDYGKWEFVDLLNVAKDVRLFDDGTNNLANIIRDARNYVHPNKQVSTCDFTSANAKISVTCLEEVVRNLNARFNQPQTT